MKLNNKFKTVGRLSEISPRVRAPYRNIAEYTMISTSEADCDTSKS